MVGGLVQLFLCQICHCQRYAGRCRLSLRHGCQFRSARGSAVAVLRPIAPVVFLSETRPAMAPVRVEWFAVDRQHSLRDSRGAGVHVARCQPQKADLLLDSLRHWSSPGQIDGDRFGPLRTGVFRCGWRHRCTDTPFALHPDVFDAGLLARFDRLSRFLAMASPSVLIFWLLFGVAHPLFADVSDRTPAARWEVFVDADIRHRGSRARRATIRRSRMWFHRWPSRSGEPVGPVP